MVGQKWEIPGKKPTCSASERATALKFWADIDMNQAYSIMQVLTSSLYCQCQLNLYMTFLYS